MDVGRQYFDMNQPNLNVIVQDGRWGLEHSPKRYQVISVDAYRPPYIPWHLTTREFFQIVQPHLTADGVMVINVGRAPDDRRLIEALASTIRSVFPSVHVVDIPRTFNSILFATVQPTSAANLRQNLTHSAASAVTSTPAAGNTVHRVLPICSLPRSRDRSSPTTWRRWNGSPMI